MTLRQTMDDFFLLESWEDKYRYLIDMGNTLSPVREDEKIAANKVAGCVSQVWLVAELGDNGQIIFRGTSDAHIVRGLIALLLKAYSDKSPQIILKTDAGAMFKKLGFEEHLSPQRSNGFYAMVKRIKAIAQAALV